jgi:hypothetical protein
MPLNLPIVEQLADCKSILVAGMGGGFDVFCGLPIYFDLVRRGFNVHLASFSFSDIETLGDGERLSDTLVGVNADHAGLFPYFPEHFLAEWFREKRGEDITIWSFHKTGVRPLLDNYQTLIERLSIDGILLIDGGVDSLMRGDEAESGTLLEDSISLVAVNELYDVPVRLLTCLGFGAEQDMTYAHTFENIARLTELGGFFGSCALTPQMAVYRDYEDAVLYVQDKPYQSASVINSSVISSVQGHYGNYHLTEKTRGSRLWISPLMSLYWFFDLRLVAERNLLYSHLRWTETVNDAYRAIYMALELIPRRRTTRVPL